MQKIEGATFGREQGAAIGSNPAEQLIRDKLLAAPAPQKSTAVVDELADADI